MTRKNKTQSFGKALTADRKKKFEDHKSQREVFTGVDTEQASRSVLQQSSLEELIATVELRKAEYGEDMGASELVDEGPTLVSTDDVIEAERVASDRRDLMSIPRRPQWSDGMTTDELATCESEVFIEWRREIACNAQEQGLHLTPYERNLDFWRQLWRTVERSDLLVQILDARDPDFYHCRDLGRYIAEVDPSKRMLLLVNKSDFLTARQRQEWAEYYAAQEIDALFFSALHELTKQAKLSTIAGATLPADDNHVAVPELTNPPKLNSTLGASLPADVDHVAVPELAKPAKLNSTPGASMPADDDYVAVPVPDDSDDDQSEGHVDDDENEIGTSPLGALSDIDLDVIDCNRLLEELISRLPERPVDAADCGLERSRKGTIGFVGYPNVGKSTVINALVGAKKVGMSSRPGKTKHIQTLELPSVGVSLCDCPGLVFPSVVATRAHLVVNNTVPIDDLVDPFQPIRLIVDKIGFQKVLEDYRCAKYVQDARARSGDHMLDDAHAFLAAFAVSRNHLLRVGVPDENWAARKILRDYVKGTLLYCEPPPGAIQIQELNEKERQDACGGNEGLDCTKDQALSNTSKGTHEDDDFDDINDFLGDVDTAGKQHMTKRKMRHLNKQMMKGGPKANQGHGRQCFSGY